MLGDMVGTSLACLCSVQLPPFIWREFPLHVVWEAQCSTWDKGWFPSPYPRRPWSDAGPRLGPCFLGLWITREWNTDSRIFQKSLVLPVSSCGQHWGRLSCDRTLPLTLTAHSRLVSSPFPKLCSLDFPSTLWIIQNPSNAFPFR